MEYTIQNGILTLTAGERGGLLMGLQHADGRQLLWGGDSAVWAGRAPVCFPWCGNVEGGWYELDGVRHAAATRHGFVRDVDHQLVNRTEDTLTFRFDHSADEVWPWAFGFETVHRLEGKKAFTICTAENRSDRPMPTQMGYHPAFRVPFVPGSAKEEYVFRFEKGDAIPLEEHLFDNDSFPNYGRGGWCRLEHVPSGKYIQVDIGAFHTTLLWSKPGIPGFVCIEPWDGFTGPQHDMAQRPGAVLLQPGERKTWTLEMDFEV